jgi:hypothetical protein
MFQISDRRRNFGSNFCLYRKPIQTLAIGSSQSLANLAPHAVVQFLGQEGSTKRVAIYLRVSTDKQTTKQSASRVGGRR